MATKEYVDNSVGSVDTSDLATREYVDDSVSIWATSEYVDNSRENVDTSRESVDTSNLATSEYADDIADECVNKAGREMTGNLDMGRNSISYIGNPTRQRDAVNKN